MVTSLYCSLLSILYSLFSLTDLPDYMEAEIARQEITERIVHHAAFARIEICHKVEQDIITLDLQGMRNFLAGSNRPDFRPGSYQLRVATVQ